jgi:uncharacterized protein (DUF1684 family)
MRTLRLLAVVGLLASTVPGLPASDPSYRASIEDWRRGREARLKADDGWLTVAGLFWLKEGANSAGSGASNGIVLPREAPERIGSFVLRNGKAVFHAERGVPVSSHGKPVSTLEMKADTSGNPDVIAIGSLSMHVIERGKRYGIRLRDKNSRFRREFTGLHWFPVNESYRITAPFVPYNPARKIAIPNVLGDTETETSPGYVVFTLGGVECKLEPVSEGGQLWFIFRDLTGAKETYPAGRFLYADPPKDGKVVLDFNKAYNPPCAFTPYATCPLPPPRNRLKVGIPAGEMRYHE